ncbi:MAG: hypothetical protein K2L81_06355 [Muribaculaceae bacterium]|nr:hypothetical protein [Muribaculaceae bacterium]
MKKIFYIVIATLVFTACTGNKKHTSSSTTDEEVTSSSQTTSMDRILSNAKDTSSSFLKSKLKFPETFQLEEFSVESEPVPVYFNAKIQKQAQKTIEALNKFSYYNDLDGGSGLWDDEKYSAVQNYRKEQAVLDSMCKGKILDSLDVRLVALVKYSGENAYGNRISYRSILIIDPEKGKKILGDFDVDEEFIKNYLMIMNVLGIEIPENEYGKTEVESLPRIDRFIYSEQ